MSLAAAVLILGVFPVLHRAGAQGRITVTACIPSAGYPCNTSPSGGVVQQLPTNPQQATVHSVGPMTFNSNFVTAYCPVNVTVKQQFRASYTGVQPEYRLERWVAGVPWQAVDTQKLRTRDDTTTVAFTFPQTESYNGLLRIVTITPEVFTKPNPLVDSTTTVPFSVVCRPRPQQVTVRAVSVAANPASTATWSGDCPHDVHFTVTVTTEPLPAGIDGDVRVIVTTADPHSHPQALLQSSTSTSRIYDVLLSPLTSQNGVLTAVATSVNQMSGATPIHLTCKNSEGAETKLPPRSH